MPDYINWYLVELRLRLQPHLNLDAVESILTEVESHLRETSIRLQTTPGMGQAHAEQEAVRAFGRPHLVATDYLRESNPKFLGMAPKWGVLGAGLLALYCWVFNWITNNGYFDNFGDTWQNGVATVVGLVALVVFFRACHASHRSYFRHILAGGAMVAVGLVFLLSFWIVGSKDGHQGLSRLHLSRDVETAKESLVRLDRLETYLQQGISAYSRAQTWSDLPPNYRDLAATAKVLDQPRLMEYHRLHDMEGVTNAAIFTIPSTYVWAAVDGRIWWGYTTTDFAGAKKAWQSDAPKTVSLIEGQRQGLKGLLVSAEEARSGRLFFFNPRVYSDAVKWSIVFVPALLLLDAMAFAWRRRRPVWPDRAMA